MRRSKHRISEDVVIRMSEGVRREEEKEGEEEEKEKEAEEVFEEEVRRERDFREGGIETERITGRGVV